MQRVQVRLEDEVSVAAGPRGHRVTLDGLHVYVYGEQVVAALSVLLGDLFEKVVGGQAFALQAALHVGHRQQHGVYPSGLYLGLEGIQVEAAFYFGCVHYLHPFLRNLS